MSAPTSHFVIFHKKGPKWPSEGLSLSDPIAQEHAQYFAQFVSQGKLLEGGPFPGHSGGMMIFDSGVGEEEVRTIAENDPARIAGIMDFEIKQWMRVFGA